jgi:predicted TIM-barrel fold metal-dependent hydrolase
MPVIDSDTHIDETEDTWSDIQDGVEFKPYTAHPSRQDPGRQPTTYWMIDGKRQLRRYRDDKRTGTTVETRELLDVEARLQAMDKLGFDVQVMYPTLFLTESTERADVDYGLRHSYNRWLARRSDESHGRLRWVCLPPVRNIDEAVQELKAAKEHGAVGVLKKGDEEAGKWPVDPYFFPLYEEAQRLDMPICFHLGSGTPWFPPAREVSYGGFLRLTLPVVHAFHSLLSHKIPDQFPTLRWGFIEAGASWIPFVYNHLDRTLLAQHGRNGGAEANGAASAENLLRANRMYVTCQVDEDLPYLLQFTGADNILMGSDYTHADQSQELDWPRLLKERADRGEIPQSLLPKVTYENPRTFYGL